MSSAAASLRHPRQGGFSSQRLRARRSTSSRSMSCSSMAALNSKLRAEPCESLVCGVHFAERGSSKEVAAMGQVAMIIDDMFEDSEMRVPYDRLTEAGYEVVLVGRE